MREVGADVIGAKAFVTPFAAKLTVGELIAALRADFDLRGILSAPNVCHLTRAEKDFGTFRAAKLTAEQVDAYVSKRLADGDQARHGQPDARLRQASLWTRHPAGHSQPDAVHPAHG